MKRGFTLVELMAVIIIIGIIFAITFPLITNSIKDSEERAYNLQVEQVIQATKDLMVKEKLVFPSNQESITISLGELKRNGLLPIEMINSKTKKTISDTSKVHITKENNSYKYEVFIVDLIENNSEYNENAPSIRLNGSYIEYVEINTKYIDKGAVAYDKDNNELKIESVQVKFNEQVVGTVDTSKLGTYKLIYSVTHNNHLVTSIRTVVVRDTTAPVITMPEKNTLTKSQINGFNVDEGVYAIDNSGETINVVSESSLTSVLGQHLVTYTAEDSSHNKTVVKRIINVVDEMNLVIKKNGTNLNEYVTETLNEKIIEKQSDVTHIVCNNDIKIEEVSEGIKLTNLAGKKSICEFSNNLVDSVKNMDNTKNHILMLSDTNISKYMTIASDKNLKLNLNGKKIISTSMVFYVQDGTLEINGEGVIKGETSSAGNGTIKKWNNSNSTLIINSTNCNSIKEDEHESGLLVSGNYHAIAVLNNISSSGEGDSKLLINGGCYVSDDDSAISVTEQNKNKAVINNIIAHSTNSHAVANWSESSLDNTANLDINGGTYTAGGNGPVILNRYGIINISNASVNIDSEIKACTTDCYAISLESGKAKLQNVTINQSGNGYEHALRLVSTASADIFDSNFSCAKGYCIYSKSTGNLNIYNTKIDAYSYAVKIDAAGTLYSENNEFYSEVTAAITNNTNSGNTTININGGKYTSKFITISNYSVGTINISDEKGKVYIASYDCDNSSHGIWDHKAISNISSGNININGAVADSCGQTENTTGICIYNEWGRSIMNETNATGNIKINGATVVSKDYYAVQNVKGNAYLCGTNISGGTYNLRQVTGTDSNGNANDGHIYYNSNVTFNTNAITDTENVILNENLVCE